jgi:hypothetical protein
MGFQVWGSNPAKPDAWMRSGLTVSQFRLIGAYSTYVGRSIAEGGGVFPQETTRKLTVNGSRMAVSVFIVHLHLLASRSPEAR